RLLVMNGEVVDEEFVIEPVFFAQSHEPGRKLDQVLKRMVDGNGQPRSVTNDGARCAFEGCRLGALDVHFDEIHAGEATFPNKVIDADGGDPPARARGDSASWPSGRSDDELS